MDGHPFKVGDTIKCHSSGGFKELCEGYLYTVSMIGESDGGFPIVYLENHSQTTHYYARRFAFMTRVKGTTGTTGTTDAKGGWREYSFSIRSKAQIDRTMIHRDLTAEEPLMVLEMEDSPLVTIFLHDSIWTKVSNIKSPYLKDQLIKMLLGADNYTIHRGLHLSYLISLVKEIKNAEWAKPHKAVVTVRRITI